MNICPICKEIVGEGFKPLPCSCIKNARIDIDTNALHVKLFDKLYNEANHSYDQLTIDYLTKNKQEIYKLFEETIIMTFDAFVKQMTDNHIEKKREEEIMDFKREYRKNNRGRPKKYKKREPITKDEAQTEFQEELKKIDELD